VIVGNYSLFYDMIKRIPRGRVATYGQIAELVDLPGHARQVGYALNALPEGHDVPWQRVISAQGRISAQSDPLFEKIQRQLLEEEGVVFDERGRIALERYQWRPG